MKTSNYISISYLIFLFGGIVVLFSAAKLDPKAKIEVKSILETKTLGSFSVLVAEPGVRLIITHDSISKILAIHNKGTISKLPPYELRNDTLFFLPYLKSDFPWIEIKCNGIKSFNLKENAHIRLAGYQGDTLMMKLEKATFICNFHKDIKQSFVLSVISKESQIQLHRPDVKKLNIQLDHSRIQTFGISIDTLSGNLKNKSWLWMNDFKRDDFEGLDVDATSHIEYNTKNVLKVYIKGSPH